VVLAAGTQTESVKMATQELSGTGGFTTVALANSDAGSAPINAVVQQWMRLSTKP
jgi:hypothetical protein